MARSRIQLHQILKNIVPNVYFQPPNGLQMKYPCIVYELSDIDTKFADNNPHFINKRYSVTVIDSNPDSDLIGKVAALPMCSFAQFFTSDNLNHDVFNLYF